MKYVDGYVLPVKKKDIKAYKKMASEAGNIWIKHGALSYVECLGDDLTTVKKFGGLPFPKMVKTKPNEAIVFAYVTYKSKSHRDKVNKDIMADPVMNDPKNKNKPIPFDLKKMAYAGFKTIVEKKKKK